MIMRLFCRCRADGADCIGYGSGAVGNGTLLLSLSAVDAFSRTGKPFLHDDTEDVKIAAAEKIDAEYLAQALFTDEEETDISYRIAGMVENGVSTGVSTADGIWDVLCHVEKMTWPIASLMSFMRRNCPKARFEMNFPIPATAILYIIAIRTSKMFMLP